jgi:uncharacterized protein YbcI
MPRSTTASGETRQLLSRGIVAIFKRHLGRGPTTARTYVNDDVITVILEDSLTSIEHTLIDSDRGEVVNDMRRGYQAAAREEIVELVESATGRRVKAFMSDHSVLPDYAVECLILEPVPGPGALPS